MTSTDQMIAALESKQDAIRHTISIWLENGIDPASDKIKDRKEEIARIEATILEMIESGTST